MSVFAELADGRRLEFPDGTDPAVIQATVKRVVGEKPAKPPGPPEKLTWAEENVAPLLDKVSGLFDAGAKVARPVVQGLATPGTAAVQIGANAIGAGEPVNKEIAEQEKAYQQSRGKDAGTFDPLRTGAEVLNPLMWNAFARLATGVTLPQKLASAARAGALGAASAPVTEGDYAEGKGKQMAMGALFGPLVQAGMSGAQALGSLGYRAIEPALKSGPHDILQRYLKELAGDGREKIVAALESARTIIPGSKPTAAEAMSTVPQASALAAHQKAVAGAPETSAEFMARKAAQEAAREGEIASIAGTDKALADAVSSRAKNAAVNYGKADPVVSKPDAELLAIFDRPSMEKAFSRAKELAKEKGDELDVASGQNLHYIKMAMDDLLKNPERFSIGAAEAKAIGATQRKFIDWIEKTNPDYGVARNQFAADSKPINQMQVGKVLKDALTGPKDEERATVFINATRNAPQTIKKAGSGQTFDKLEEVLTPEQMGKVNNVIEELVRSEQAKRLAQGTNLTGATAIESGEKGVKIPNLLSRTAMITNFGLKLMREGADQKINRIAGEAYLNPSMLADMLKEVPKSERQKVIEAMLEYSRNPMFGATGQQIGQE